MSFKWRDETGAQDLVNADASRNVDIGGGTPASGGFSMDGNAIRSSAGKIGTTRVGSTGVGHTVGSVTLDNAQTSTITHNLGRTALAFVERVALVGLVIFTHNANDFVIKHMGHSGGPSDSKTGDYSWV